MKVIGFKKSYQYGHDVHVFVMRSPRLVPSEEKHISGTAFLWLISLGDLWALNITESTTGSGIHAVIIQRVRSNKTAQALWLRSQGS